MRSKPLAGMFLTMTLIVSACATSPEVTDDSAASTSTVTTSGQPTPDAIEALCPALRTWHAAQQRFLDNLSDVSLAELDQRSPRVLQAGVALGNTLVEVNREAIASGCAAALIVGSSERCAQIARLEAAGPAAQNVLDLLMGECA